MPLKVSLVCSSKFQFFNLARQLHERDMLAAIFTGYPKWKLKNEDLPPELIRSFPWVQALYMTRMRTASKRKNSRVDANLEWLSNRAIDNYAAARVPACDAVMTVANMGLRTGQVVQRRGGVYVCDRPCSHVRYQNRLLHEEFARYGGEFQGIDPRSIAREEREYAQADCVAVPSTFSMRSFLEMGVPAAKVRRIVWGVDLSRFRPVAQPAPDTFEVLFVGSVTLRKGVPYLLEAFEKLQHPRKKLTIVGTLAAEVLPMIEAARSRLPISIPGHVAQDGLKELMSRSHVFVLPTIEDGFGMVMAEAMACGCPVIATTNSGGPDIFEDGKEGFIIPIRDADALANRLQSLADSPAMRDRMSQLSLERVHEMGGWNTYGANVITMFEELVAAKKVRSQPKVATTN